MKKVYMPRLLENELEANLNSSGCVLIAGPKFCGKTTLGKKYAKSETNLKTSNDILLAEIDPKSALLGDRPHIIDEWQKRLDLRIFQDMNKLNAAKAIEDYIKSLDLSEFSKYAQGVISITSGVINTFISIVAAIYMLIDKQLIIKSTKNIISVILSKEKSESICGYFAKVNDIFSKYIYCKVVEAIIISIITTIALSVLGVKYAMILGLMAGFLNLIPYFGSIIGTIVIMIIALVSGGIFKCIWTGITLTILEQIDGNYIGPKIMGEVLEIRPLAVIFAVSVGGGLFGIPGMLFSIPISVVIKMMYEDYANKKRGLKEAKDDSSEVPPENDSPQKE